MYYAHEAREQSSGSVNTIWPEMSTNERDMVACLQYLYERNLDPFLAEENGWYPSRKAADHDLRIVIPAVVRIPKQVYWQARAIGSSHIRYQSPRGPREGALIYIAAEQTEPSNKVVVVEGPMDALAA